MYDRYSRHGASAWAAFDFVAPVRRVNRSVPSFRGPITTNLRLQRPMANHPEQKPCSHVNSWQPAVRALLALAVFIRTNSIHPLTHPLPCPLPPPLPGPTQFPPRVRALSASDPVTPAPAAQVPSRPSTTPPSVCFRIQPHNPAPPPAPAPPRPLLRPVALVTRFWHRHDLDGAIIQSGLGQWRSVFDKLDRGGRLKVAALGSSVTKASTIFCKLTRITTRWR